MNREGTDMSIMELIEGMKEDADEIIGKGEVVKDFLKDCYNKPCDAFEAIRRKARKMTNDGEMTSREATAWINEQDKKIYADSQARFDALPKDPVKEPKDWDADGYKRMDGTYQNADGSIDDPVSISIHDDDYKVRFPR